MGSRLSRQSSLEEESSEEPCAGRLEGGRGDFNLSSLLLHPQKLPGVLRKASPAPYVRRVGWLREIQATIREQKREHAVHILRLLRKDLGLEGTFLNEVLYKNATFLNLVDPISHDLLMSLARDLQCPKKEYDPWKSSDRICRQLIYHLTPHSKWHRHGVPRRKSQMWKKELKFEQIHVRNYCRKSGDLLYFTILRTGTRSSFNDLDSDLSMRTLSTPSPALIFPSNSPGFQNGRGSSTSSSSVTGETIAMVHSPPPTRLAHPLIRLASKHQKEQANIDRLPDHAMILIFSFLPTNQLCRCARVCRRWYNLAWDPRLWRTIRLTGETINVDRALKVLTRRLCQDTPNVCLMLETVIVSGCRRLTDRGLYTIAQCCPELRRMEVSGCYNISNEAVFDVVSLCPNLEHLDVSGCSKVTCISLTREASIKLSPLHGKQISIRYLDMTDCFVLEDEGLHTIAAHCTQLTHLYLRRCVRITDEGLRYLMIYCTSIKELSVSDCRFVSDFGMREIAKLEGRLRYLSIAHCCRITDVGVRYVAKYCSKLRYLNARGCEGITDHGLEYLAKNCTKLKSLDIGKCPLVSDAGLEFLALNCFNLKRLSLKSCESISGQGLQIVAANCFDLQMLNVQDCDVSVDALRFVKRHCKRCIIEHTNPAFF